MMQIDVNWDPKVSSQFQSLAISVGLINDVCNDQNNQQLCHLKKTIYAEVRETNEIDRLKEDPTVRAYRDFYWKLNIDPTKTRPSGEALLRRVLHGDELPNVSAAVDAYNLASMKTKVPISGFDRDLTAPPFQIRFAEENENFIGIGMRKPLLLKRNMLILADEKQPLCIYPYRDCDSTKITLKTRNVALVGYGVAGTAATQIQKAVAMALSFIELVAEGEIGGTVTFRSGRE
jgi:DNA/RNA-binding domain of Phe-tRNA-synthetase-like protein